MEALILDGSKSSDSFTDRLHEALLAELHRRGWQSEHILLREQKIGNCAGDFFIQIVKLQILFGGIHV